MNDTSHNDSASTPAPRPAYDETAIKDETLADANSTRAEADRGAFNPRGRLRIAGGGLKAGIVVAAGFLGFLVYSMSERSEKKDTGPDDSTFHLTADDKAEKSARQAAQVMAQPGDPKGAQVGTDPFGNPIMADNGQDLSNGQAVPGVDQGGDANRIEQRLERARQQRENAIQAEIKRQDSMRRAPIMAVTQSDAGQAQAASTSASATGDRGPFSNLTLTSDVPGGGGRTAPRQPNEIEKQLNGMDIQRVTAGKLPNQNFLVTAGMQIPCVLQVAMDSTQPGLTSCIIPRDVWSANGSVILMEKGTRVLGEYNGGFTQGQRRIFILWNRAVTPKGISVSLGSPAADALGRAGMGGKVDSFFWQRFGGALLLSIVGDAGDALSDRISGADQTFNAPNQAAALAAQGSQSIRPRLTAPQGQEMTIMVARDVDFSSVYSLRLRR